MLAYLVLVPLTFLLWGSFHSSPLEAKASFTLKNYFAAYGDPKFYRLFWNSFLYAGGTCIVALFLGTSLAWVYERTNAPGKRYFGIIAIVPFIIPGILSTISWILLLSPRIGVLNLWLKGIFSLDKPLFNIYSLSGMIWAEAVHLYPLVFLMMSAAFRSMDMSLEEAATMSGAGMTQTFFRITMPLLRPALFSTLLIMFIRTLEAFEVPALVGLPANIDVFTTQIYLAVHEFPPNFGLAGALAVTLLFLSGMGVYLYRRATRHEKMFATVTGKGFRPRLIDLGRFRYGISVLCFLFFSVTIGLPLFVLLWSSLVSFYEAPHFKALSRLTIRNYKFIFGYPHALVAFKNSFFLMFLTPTITMLVTSVIAWITVKSKFKGRGVLDFLAFLPIAFPGIVLGVSLLYVYLLLPVPIYGTIWILLVAYITKYLPYGIRTTGSTIIQIHQELEEAAAISGAAWGVTFRKILLPLMMPGLLAGWIYIAMVSLRELSTSILLYSSGSEVLSIIVFDLWESGRYPALCALGIIMIVLLTVLAFGVAKLGGKMGIKREVWS